MIGLVLERVVNLQEDGEIWFKTTQLQKDRKKEVAGWFLFQSQMGLKLKP